MRMKEYYFIFSPKGLIQTYFCRILVRAISYTVHGLIPASCVFADRYNREEVVRSLGKEVNINPPLTLGQLPDTPEELLKLDQVTYSLDCLSSVYLKNITFYFKSISSLKINPSSNHVMI